MCRTRRCKDNKKKSTKAQAAPNAPSLVVSSESEGERLWRHVLFGTGTCLGMIEGYAALNMPGDPLPQLHSLRDRLTHIINTLETRAVPSERKNRSAASSAAE